MEGEDLSTEYERIHGRKPDFCIRESNVLIPIEVACVYSAEKQYAESRRSKKHKIYPGGRIFIIHPFSPDFSYLTERDKTVYKLMAALESSFPDINKERRHVNSLIEKLKMPESITEKVNSVEDILVPEIDEYLREGFPILNSVMNILIDKKVASQVEINELAKGAYKFKDEPDLIEASMKEMKIEYGHKYMTYFPIWSKREEFKVRQGDNIECSDIDRPILQAVAEMENGSDISVAVKAIRELNIAIGKGKKHPETVVGTTIEIMKKQRSQLAKTLNSMSSTIKGTDKGTIFLEMDKDHLLHSGIGVKRQLSHHTGIPGKDSIVEEELMEKIRKDMDFQNRPEVPIMNFNKKIKKCINHKTKDFPLSEIVNTGIYENEQTDKYMSELLEMAETESRKILGSKMVNSSLWNNHFHHEVYTFSTQVKSGSGKIFPATINKSGITNCYYVITPIKNSHETGAIRVIFKGDHSPQHMQLKYYKCMINGEVFWISAAFTLNTTFCKEAQYMIGSILGTHASYLAHGNDMSKNVWLNGVNWQYNQQTINYFDINYILVKNALVEISLGKSDIQDKMKDVVVNDITLANFIFHTLGNIESISREGRKAILGNKGVYIAGLDMKFDSIQAFFDLMYVKNIKSKAIMEDPTKLMGTMYAREQTFNMDYEKSEYKNEFSPIPDIPTDMQKFEQALIKNGDFTKATIFLPGAINAAIKTMTIENPWAKDPTYYTNLFGSAFSGATRSKTRIPEKHESMGESPMGKGFQSQNTAEALYQTEKLAKIREYLNKIDPMTQFELTLVDCGYYGKNAYQTIALKEQTGGKRIFFIQGVQSRNNNQMLDTYCTSFLKDRDDDLIAKKGNEKLIHLFSIISALKGSTYTGVSMDKTKYGDKYMVECFKELMIALYRAKYLTKQECMLFLWFLKGLHNRILMRPVEVTEFLKKNSNLQGSFSISEVNKHSTAFERKVRHFFDLINVEEQNHLLFGPQYESEGNEPTFSLYGELKKEYQRNMWGSELRTYNNFLYRRVGFTLGVLNFASTILSCAIDVIKKHFMIIMGLDPGKGFCQSDDSSNLAVGKCPTADFIRLNRITLKPKEEQTQEEKILMEKLGPFISVCCLVLGSYMMGQIPSWVKWTMADNLTEILQTVTIFFRDGGGMNVKNHVPHIRYMAGIGTAGTKESPTTEISTKIGILYDLVTHGENGLGLFLFMIFMNKYISYQFNYKDLDMCTHLPTQLGGCWLNLPLFIKRHGVRTQLYRLMKKNPNAINNMLSIERGAPTEDALVNRDNNVGDDSLYDFKINFRLLDNKNSWLMKTLGVETTMRDRVNHLTQTHGWEALVGIDNDHTEQLAMLKKHLSPSFRLKASKLWGGYINLQMMNYGNLMTRFYIDGEEYIMSVKKAQGWLSTLELPIHKDFKLIETIEENQINDLTSFSIDFTGFTDEFPDYSDYRQMSIPYTTGFAWDDLKLVLASISISGHDKVWNKVTNLYPGILSESWDPLWVMLKVILPNPTTKECLERKDQIRSLIEGRHLQLISKNGLDKGLFLEWDTERTVTANVLNRQALLKVFSNNPFISKLEHRATRGVISCAATAQWLIKRISGETHTVRTSGVEFRNCGDHINTFLKTRNGCGGQICSGFLAVLMLSEPDFMFYVNNDSLLVVSTWGTFKLTYENRKFYIGVQNCTDFAVALNTLRYMSYFSFGHCNRFYTDFKHLNLLDTCRKLLIDRDRGYLGTRCRHLGVNFTNAGNTVNFTQEEGRLVCLPIYQLDMDDQGMEGTYSLKPSGGRMLRIDDEPSFFYPDDLVLTSGMIVLKPWETMTKQTESTWIPNYPINTDGIIDQQLINHVLEVLKHPKATVFCDVISVSLFQRCISNFEWENPRYFAQSGSCLKDKIAKYQKLTEVEGKFGWHDFKTWLSLSGLVLNRSSWLFERSNNEGILLGLWEVPDQSLLL
jgi:hypothetical protein